MVGSGVIRKDVAFTSPPTGSISINSGSNYTNNLIVNLTLSALDDDGVSKMCISYTSTCTAWEIYATSKAWTLAPGDGLKTVYVWFQDGGGNITTTPYSATITLDTLTTTAQPRGKIFSAPISVSLTTNKAATVYYTTDGTVPTASSPHGDSPVTININSTTVLKFFAHDGHIQESVKMERYVVAPSGWGPFGAGGSHTLALKSDGTLWAWGNNIYGRLGLGDTNQRNTPTQVGSDASWVTVAAGSSHTLALKSDGTLWAWGDNSFGQLGMGDTNQRNTPTRVDIDSTWVALAGDNHTLALKADGTLWAWGINIFGELGLGDTNQRHTPTRVGTDSTWVAVEAGYSHTLALKSDGTLWAWGYNSFGQLGMGDTNQRNTPTRVGTDSTWVAVAGDNHTLALKADGTLWAWGHNSFGQLGMGDTNQRHTPTQVGTDSTWVAVEAGYSHTLALKSDGTLWAWGDNRYGQLGLGDTNQGNTPTQVSSGSSWVALAVGGNHTIALKADGVLWAWGYNFSGQLGDGTTTQRNLPVLVDIYPPTNPSVLINGGTAYTNSLNVTLSLHADDTTGISQMCISNSSTCTTWESYGASKSWTLELGDGLKNVNAWFKDYAGFTSPMASPSITLDMTLPQGSFTINNGSTYTVSQNVTLNLSATDNYGITTYFASENGTLPAQPNWVAVTPTTIYSSNAAFPLSTGDGQKTVYVWFKDIAGNISTPWSRQIILDTEPPSSGTSVSIKDQEGNLVTATNSQTLTLTLASPDTGTGTVEMEISNDGVIYEWKAFSQTTTWTLSGETGDKTIYVKFKDGAGFVSDPVTYIIRLDTTSPVPVITQPSDGAILTSLYEIRGTVADASPSGGLSKTELQVAGGGYYLTTNPSAPWVSTPTFFIPSDGTVASWTHNTSGVNWLSDTTYTITARATDQAGNVGTSSATFSYCLIQFSADLSMDVSSQMILFNGTVSVAGKLTRLPDNGKSLKNLPIKLTITDPDGAITAIDEATYDDAGHYIFENVSGFTKKGAYTVQAQVVRTGCILGTTSLAKSVLVGRSAGYAILVEGRITNNEGIASHNKTSNRIYQKLRERGFVDDNIYYFNYNNTSQPTGIVVDEVPSKGGVQTAVTTWAKNKMNSQAAPLYIIMVDHGTQGGFYLNDTTISPQELASWLSTLEGGLTGEASQEKIIVIIGACYSGSFIPSLSKQNRVIIASTATDEESYKGLMENDGVRSGEYFLDEFFIQLGRGYSFKKSFEEATAKTREFTRKGGSTNALNKYLDTSVQHPLLDDNGDSKGSNLLSPGVGDGQFSRSAFLGTGPTYDTNAAGNRAEVVEVTETLYLNPLSSTATLWLKANVPSDKISTAGLMIRPPSVELSGRGTAGSDQLFIDLPTQFLTYDSTYGYWYLNVSNHFTESGRYEVFYFVRDSQTGEISPLRRSLAYKDKMGNNAPTAPSLISPADGATTKTVLVFKWNPVTDPDGDAITYNILIKDINGNVIYRKEGINTTMTFVDNSAGFKDLTTYFWQVEAVDTYGRRSLSLLRSFSTNNTNYIPGIIQGIVYSDQAAAMIAAATVTATIGSYTITMPTGQNGNYALEVRPGDTVSIECTKSGYQTASITNVIVQAGESTNVNISLSGATGPGDLNGDTKVDLADAILALKVVSGITSTIHKEADVNNDGKIGLAEVIYILQKMAGMR